LSDPEPLSRQHYHRSGGIAGRHGRGTGRVSSCGLQPPDQIPHGPAGSAGLGGRVERRQMQPALGGCPTGRLSLYLDQFVVAGERGGWHSKRVLRRFRYAGPASSWFGGGTPGRPTGSNDQEGKPQGEPGRQFRSAGLIS
jgi:hypothetical protein